MKYQGQFYDDMVRMAFFSKRLYSPFPPNNLAPVHLKKVYVYITPNTMGVSILFWWGVMVYLIITAYNFSGTIF